MVYEVVEVDYDDYEFIFYIIKLTLKEYIDSLWGWNEDVEHLFFKEEMTEENAFIIKVDNERIGYLSLLRKKDEVEVENLLLLPKFQNKGLGRGIIKNLIEECRKEEKKLVLKTFKANKRANKFYRKLGFDLIEENEDYYKYTFKLKKPSN